MTERKTYVGTRNAQGEPEVHVRVEGEALSARGGVAGRLYPLAQQRPDRGLEWARGLSGPANVAASILADHLGPTPVDDLLANGLTLGVIVHLPAEGWQLPAERVAQAIKYMRAQEKQLAELAASASMPPTPAGACGEGIAS